MDEDNLLKRFLEVLSEEWQSTSTIAKKCGIHWYRAEVILVRIREGRLKTDVKLEELNLPRGHYWKIENGK